MVCVDVRLSKQKQTENKEAQSQRYMDVPSITEIKRAIPAHCFQSSLLRSLYYAVFDLTLLVGLFVITQFFLEKIHWAFLVPYIFLQGLFECTLLCCVATNSFYDMMDGTP